MRANQLKHRTAAWCGRIGTFVLLFVFHTACSYADPTTPIIDGVSSGSTEASSPIAPTHSDLILTGKESMWGVVGHPSNAVLKLVNASPLLKSALNAYQDAVDGHGAIPFGELQEDWSGAKLVISPAREKQLVMSPDVLAETPQDFVGDLSHGLGYFYNYDRDKRLYDDLVPSHADGRRASVIAGGVGVWMESRAEVYNFLVQQQIINASRAARHGPIAIKLANNDRSGGLLQAAFDKQLAVDHQSGLSEDEIQGRLENLAYILTGNIAVPKRSAVSSAPSGQAVINQSDIPVLAAGGSKSDDRDTVINGFLTRLKSVADSGMLDDVDKTMKTLNMGYNAQTSQMAASPPDCAIDWHPKSELKTIAQRTGNDWYGPTQFGILNFHVPVFFANAPEVIKDAPEMLYTVTHTVRCTDSFRIQDSTEAKLDLFRLPPFACITVPDIVRVFPGVRPHFATDGALPYAYQGHLDDDTGTDVTFAFRAGASCALGVNITQSQENGLRFRRAVYKFQLCWAEKRVDYCAAHKQDGADAPNVQDMSQYIIKRCPTMNALYLKEPHTGDPPPASPLGPYNSGACH